MTTLLAKDKTMWKAFSRLAEANVNHYNNHPTRHTIITGVYAVVALVGATHAAKKIALTGEDPSLRSGQYAK